MSAPLRIAPFPVASSALSAPAAAALAPAAAPGTPSAAPAQGSGSLASVAPAAAAPQVKATAAAAASAAPAANTATQQYMERLIKLIPAEVVAIYLVGIGVIPPDAKLGKAIWAVVCLGLVVLSRAYATSDQANKIPTEWKSVFVSSVSFTIWVYNMPGPFQAYGLEVSYIGALAVLVWTFVVPYFYKG
jgi:hypothetical protein